MKKLLSIICTLAIVLGVVLVPGMFSASAVNPTELTALTPSAVSTNVENKDVTDAADAPVTKNAYGFEYVSGTDSGHKNAFLVFDYALEAGYSYYLEYEYLTHSNKFNRSEVKVGVAASKDAAAMASTDAKRVITAPSYPNAAWKKYGTTIVADAFPDFNETNKYLAINLANWGDVWVANIKIAKLDNTLAYDKTGAKYIYPTNYRGNNKMGALASYDNGNVDLTANRGCVDEAQFTFNYELKADKAYVISYDLFNSTKTWPNGGPGTGVRIFANQTPFDNTERNTKAVNVGVLGFDNAWYRQTHIIYGKDVVTETEKYLTIHIDAPDAVNKIRNFTVEEFTPVEGVIYPSYVGAGATAVGGSDAKSDVILDVDANGELVIKNLKGYYRDMFVTFNYELDANKEYKISFQPNGDMAGGSRPYFGNAASATSQATQTAKKMFKSPQKLDGATYVLYAKGSELISGDNKYFAFIHKMPYVTPSYKNFKIEEVTPTNSSYTDGSLYSRPTVGSTVMEEMEENDIVYESYDNNHAWWAIDANLEAGATYRLTYDYRGHNWNNGGAKLAIYGVDVSAADPKAAKGSKSVALGEPSSKTAFTTKSVTFKADDVIDGTKNDIIILGSGYPNEAGNYQSFKSFKLEKLADYSEVDAAIEDAEELDETLYKDFSDVNDAITAVVRDKLASEQAAVDAMAKAINDAIAALELKDADYTAVDAAIAAANALNPADYVDFSGVTNAINAVDRTKKITEQAEVDAMAKAINDAVAALVYDGANYSAVDAAIAAANALVKANYVDFSAVDAAIAAVQRGLDVTEQATVDGYATAINAAIAALELKAADYAAVDAAIAAANALVKANYVDFSAVEAAIAAVVRDKDITAQAEVDAMAKAINDAIAALVKKDADYAAVNAAKDAAEDLDKDLYKDFSAVDAAIAAVVEGKKIDEQTAVDAMAKAINDAVAALELKDADYSALDALIDEAEALNAEDYTNYDAVQEILDEITDDKNITEQDEVDAWAEALEAAIDALIERADYSAFIEIAEKYEDEIGEEAEYTEESVAALKAVMDKIAANANLPADKQAEVDALAEEFEAAIKALVKKPVADNNDSKVEDKEDEKVEDNKTDKTPDKTGDSSNIVVAIAALAASVIGLAVLVIGKKRRA